MNIEVNIEEKEPKYLYKQCRTCKAVDTCMYRELFKEIEKKFQKEWVDRRLKIAHTYVFCDMKIEGVR